MLGVLYPLDLSAQDRRITGTVVQAASGEPIAAAEISVGAGFAATLSNAEGRFIISVPAGEVRLQVRAFGFQRTEVTVPANQTTVQISMETDVFRMDELVVTGQATTIERRSATTAIEYVSGEELTKVPATTVLSALNGKVAGVNLQANSGAPGGGMQMQIRGNATLLGAFDPLYVVDGVIYSNATIPGGRGYANAAALPSMEAALTRDPRRHQRRDGDDAVLRLRQLHQRGGDRAEHGRGAAEHPYEPRPDLQPAGGPEGLQHVHPFGERPRVEQQL